MSSERLHSVIFSNWSRDSQPNIKWSLGNPVEEGEDGLKELERQRIPQKKKSKESTNLGP